MQGMKLRLPFLRKTTSVNVVRLHGMIGTGGRSALNDAALAPVLERAFSKGKPAAVAISVNSPGGSPVQSSLIGSRIRRLSEEKEIPVFAFVEDVAASGGYWLASCADEIFADPASIVGSIGVISAGFGLQDLIARYGIERRVYTAGKSKSMLDPFREEKQEDVERLTSILGDVHDVFIQHVKTSRGAKITQDIDVFTGEVWLAERAKELGLIDEIGHLVPTLKVRFGDKVKLRVIEQKRSFSQRIGLSISDSVVGTLEERIALSRFGL